MFIEIQLISLWGIICEEVLDSDLLKLYLGSCVLSLGGGTLEPNGEGKLEVSQQLAQHSAS